MQHLTTSHLTALLKEERTAISAAWIVEGLSRREYAAIELLCNDATLMNAFLGQLEYAATHRSEMGDYISPALRAIATFSLSLERRYVGMFLATSSFVNAINTLLGHYTIRDDDSTIMVNCLYVTSCFLSCAGISSHASSDIAVPQFLPRVIALLVSGQATAEWQREAVCAIRCAIREPPTCDEQDPVIEANLVSIMETFLWAPSVREQLLDALVRVLVIPDMDAVLASLFIIDRLLRTMPESRYLFQCVEGVARLEEVCDRAAVDDSYSDDVELAASMAADLLDDFYYGYDEDEDDEEITPTVESGSFAFGVSAPMPTLQFGNGAPAMDATMPVETPPQGRGRGRTMPAWMTQQ